ncbi:MAG: SDR family oxidoreductase [Gammaproteobacteria bacterium]|nr:SDR family oxidoreductase [Gammaproteobacteria bacterium]
MPVDELKGEVALVTGGAHNIGRAICLDLADAGAAVVVNALSSGAAAQALADEIEAAGGQAMAVVADICDPKAVERMVAAIVERFGTLTILVNNACVRGITRIEDLTLAEWRRISAPTLEGTFLCSQAAVPHMRAAGRGVILSLGGISSHTGTPGRTHVAAANVGIIGFSKALAHEVGMDGIRVNVLVPGHIDTDRGAAAGSRPAHKLDFLVEDRMGRPQEVAAMVRALCGPAGRYMTGQTVHVNGGAYLP